MSPVVLIGLLIVHGVAHLPGFAVPWRLLASPELPYRTTIFAGRLEVGDLGVRAVGVAWAVLAVAFLAMAWAVWADAPWARVAIVVAVAASLMLCTAGWPEARIGVVANLLILGLLAATR